MDELSSIDMGTACTRTVERGLAAVGAINGAPTQFESSLDVSYGGLLLALPALAENGLFRHLENTFEKVRGYYTTLHIILLLAYMALSRIKNVESLRYEPPGELGKILGLDRIPEVRCLRNKITSLSEDKQAEKWQGILSKDWMDSNPDSAGTLYIDGHVSVYHGRKAKIPKRYVSRQRLCLRGTTGYWVNDSIGNPFFVVERVVDDGMLNVLRKDIIPRLLEDVPNQPSSSELKKNKYLKRCSLIFDREGYSPSFFKESWETHRISCLTYRKNVKDKWAEDQFQAVEVPMPSGERVVMKLAEMGTYLGNQKGGAGLWVREVRKLKESGHQTSLVSTDFEGDLIKDAGKMFSRWSQENFFRYMMQNYSIDRLCEHSFEQMSEPQKLVNPKWRSLDSEIKSLNAKLARRLVEYAKVDLNSEEDQAVIEKNIQKKADLVELIEDLELEVCSIKKEKQGVARHIFYHQLPEEEQFLRLAPSKKQLLDAVKMVAYRAETALSMIAKSAMKKPNESRSLIKDIFKSEADIEPDYESMELKVYLHFMSTTRDNDAVRHLVDELNASEYIYPGTNLKLRYFLGRNEV